jgi:hypothetical protein
MLALLGVLGGFGLSLFLCIEAPAFGLRGQTGTMYLLVAVVFGITLVTTVALIAASRPRSQSEGATTGDEARADAARRAAATTAASVGTGLLGGCAVSATVALIVTVLALGAVASAIINILDTCTKCGN